MIDTELLKLFINSENLFGLTFAVLVVGTGRWFVKSGWPRLTEFSEKRQEQNHQLRREDLEDRRELNHEMLKALADLREEIGGFRAVQEQIAAILIPSISHSDTN